MQLVGRGPEIAALEGALDGLAAGERPMLVLRGDAGIGKTRLLASLTERARERRLDPALGRATELESDVPLALFRDALPHLVPPVGDDAGARWEMFRDVAAELGSRSRLVLVLDDAHWADPASLELLETLVRRPPDPPHLLVIALRPGPVADAVVGAARSAGRAITVLDLAPLSRAASDTLVGAERNADDRRRLFETSGGNPLFLEELARADDPTAVPDGIVSAVSADLARLSEEARALVEAGSVLGDPFDIDIARRTAALDMDAALSGVDELVVRGLVKATATLREFSFRHPVIRSAVYEGQSAARRLAGHARAAAVLAETGRPLPSRARHLAVAAAPGDIEAATLLRAAAVLVRSPAPSIAADWLLAAKRVSPPTDFGPFSDLAEVLVQSGRLNEALGTADEGLSYGHGSDVDQRRLVLAAGSVERLLGRHDAAQRRLVRALAVTRGASGKADLAAALALLAYERGEYAEMARWAADARAEPTADGLVRGASAAMLAVVHRFSGLLTDSGLEAAAAVAEIHAATDAELAARAELVVAIPWSLAAVERLPDALQASRRGSAAARRAGNLAGAVPMLVSEVMALGLLGRTEEGVQAADRTVLAARLTHNDQSLQWALWMQAWILLDRGDVEEALAAAGESVALAEHLDQSALVTIANAVLGAALLASGDPQQARPLLAAYDVEPGWIARWAPRLVEADLALGDVAEAQTSADRATAVARESGLSGALAAADRAQAMVQLARGDAVLAGELALSSIDHAVAIGASLDEAQARILAGRALANVDVDAAAQQLTEAHALAIGGGARRTAEEATRELRRLGRRIGRGGTRGVGATGLEALSGREREIAGLVAQGLTNREIATRLFLSEKTVESHLSKAFAKLGVSSRAALAAQVASG